MAIFLRSTDINNKLHAIQPTLGVRFLSHGSKNRYELIMNRIRIGHTYLTQKYLLHGDEQPFCIACNEALMVRHVFVDCMEFMDVQDQYFSVAGLKELFDNVAVNVILNFIREAGLRFSI